MDLFQLGQVMVDDGRVERVVGHLKENHRWPQNCSFHLAPHRHNFHRPDLPPAAIRNYSPIPYQQPSCPPDTIPFPPWPPSTTRQYLFRPAHFPPRLQILLRWHIPKIRPSPSRRLQVLLWLIKFGWHGHCRQRPPFFSPFASIDCERMSESKRDRQKHKVVAYQCMFADQVHIGHSKDFSTNKARETGANGNQGSFGLCVC